MKRLALSLAILSSLFVASPSVSAASCATG
ncbi:MAG: hypothetical protein RJA15_1068, partial [Actinomycetota bacterium]